MRIENEKSRVARAGGENVGVRIEAVGRGYTSAHYNAPYKLLRQIC